MIAAVTIAPTAARAQTGQAGVPLPPKAASGAESGPAGPPTLPPRRVGSAPSSGGAGAVSDFFGSDQPGGASVTSASGGIEKSGAPGPQASGQSGDSIYPY